MLTPLIVAAFAQTVPPPHAPYPIVLPIAETAPVDSPNDAADDPAFWICAADPARSLVLGTNKKAGLDVYTLSGDLVTRRADGRLNTVDVRQGVRPRGSSEPLDLAVASNRSSNTLVLYRIDPRSGSLTPLGEPISTGLSALYGLCFYHRPAAPSRPEALFILANDKSGAVEQYELSIEPAGVFGRSTRPRATLVRTFHVGAQVEGMVADDDRAVVYIGEEDLGIWRYPAEPPSADMADSDQPPRELIVRIRPWGPLVPDVEGIAIYNAGGGAGYLVVSSQGDNSFHVFRRDDPTVHLGAFRVGATDSIDAVEHTDGIDVTSAALPGAFARGVLAVHDGDNAGANQNFKLIPWSAVEQALKLPEGNVHHAPGR
jgi:3-phytase